MILLLSTAANLFWLGRYAERLKTYDRLLHSPMADYDSLISKTKVKFTQAYNPTQTLTLGNLLGSKKTRQPLNDLPASSQGAIASGVCIAFGFSNACDLDELAHHLHEGAIPKTIKQIENNVQQVRGVIRQDTFELYNLVKRLSDGDSQHAACLQLHACEAAMRTEDSLVKLFWQIGSSLEAVDNALRLHEPIDELTTKLASNIYALPENTRWHELDRNAGMLKKHGRTKDFNQLNDQFNELLNQGV